MEWFFNQNIGLSQATITNTIDGFVEAQHKPSKDQKKNLNDRIKQLKVPDITVDEEEYSGKVKLWNVLLKSQ